MELPVKNNLREKEKRKGNKAPREMTIDDFLSLFNFKMNEVMPTGCNDMHRALYGFPEEEIGEPQRIRMSSETLPGKLKLDAQVDVDSVLWNMREISIKVPLTIYPNPSRIHNIDCNHQYVICPGREKPVPMGRTAHCLFGRARGCITIHAIFPDLAPTFLPSGQDFLTADLQRLWYDKVIQRAFFQCLSPFKLQHTRPSWDNAAEFDINAAIGHTISPDCILQITKTMRQLIMEDDCLRPRFGNFFFHASFKGKKMATSILLSNLKSADDLQAWRNTVDAEYSGVFSREGIKSMYVDVGMELIGSTEATKEHGPIHLAWKMDAATKLNFGISKAPRRMEWWLTADLGGCVFDVGPENPIEFDMEGPEITYVQTYQLDKEVVSGKTNHWMRRLDWKDMNSSSPLFKRSSDILRRGMIEGSKMSTGVRVEVRMASRVFYGSSDLGGLLPTCQRIISNPFDYILALPSLIAWRFKATCLWLIEDGVSRLVSTPSCPEEEAFRMILASLYRGMYRGIYFTYNRAIVFGPRTRSKETSYGIALMIAKTNLPYRPYKLVDCFRGMACLNGLRGSLLASESLMVDLGGMLGHNEMEDLGLMESSDMRDIKGISRTILNLLRKDMINASLAFQTVGTMTTWSLEGVRRTIPMRIENPIGSRRSIKTWRRLFDHYFPSGYHSAVQMLEKRARWTRASYIPAYVSVLRAIHLGQGHLQDGTLSQLQEEIWEGFKALDCTVRSMDKGTFAHVKSGKLFIDLQYD